MDSIDSLPLLSIGLIIVVALISGPFGVVDLTTDPAPCDENVFPGTGNTSVDVLSTPKSVTLTKSRFGAAVYRLHMPPARVTVSDVEGRPTLSYKIRIPELATELGSTTILSSCTVGEQRLTIQEAKFQPGEMDAERYDATLFIVYRGIENGTNVERELAIENVTIEVTE